MWISKCQLLKQKGLKHKVNDRQKEQFFAVYTYMEKYLFKWETLISLNMKSNLEAMGYLKNQLEEFQQLFLFKVNDYLKEMLAARGARPSHSPYSSNVVIIRKKAATIRFCVDIRS